MASIRPRGSKFQVLYRENGKQTSETFLSLEEAQAFKSKLDKPVEVVDTAKRGHVTVGGYVYDVIDGHSVRETTKDSYRHAARHLVAGLGGTCVKDLTASKSRKFIAEFAANHSYSLSAQVLKVLRLTVHVAQLDDILNKDVTAGIKLQRSRVKTPVVITPDGYRALLRAVPEDYRLLVEFLAVTGCRWGEAMGLKEDCVTERSGRWCVQVRRTIAEVGPKLRPVLRNYAKTASSIRDVSVPDEFAKRLLAGADDEGWIFRAPNGAYLSRSHLWKVWNKATAAAGIPGATVHGLRHFHVSVLLDQGKPLLAVSKRVGHADMTITASVYAHLIGDDDPILDALGAFAAESAAA